LLSLSRRDTYTVERLYEKWYSFIFYLNVAQSADIEVLCPNNTAIRPFGRRYLNGEGGVT